MHFRKQSNNINEISDISIKKADIQFSAFNLLSQYQLPKKQNVIGSTVKKKKIKDQNESSKQQQNSMSTKQKSRNNGQQIMQKQRSKLKHSKNSNLISSNNCLKKKQIIKNIPKNIEHKNQMIKIRCKSIKDNIKQRIKSSDTYFIQNNFHNNINVCPIPTTKYFPLKTQYNPYVIIEKNKSKEKIAMSNNQLYKNQQAKKLRISSIKKSRSTTSLGRPTCFIQQNKKIQEPKQKNRKIIMRDYFGINQQVKIKQIEKQKCLNQGSKNSMKVSKKQISKKSIAKPEKELKNKKSRGKFF